MKLVLIFQPLFDYKSTFARPFSVLLRNISSRYVLSQEPPNCITNLEFTVTKKDER